MSSFPSFHLHLWWRLVGLILLLSQSSGINIDGMLLLSLKNSIIIDPLGVLQSWSYYDKTPCSWNGVTCGSPAMSDASFRVIALCLPNSQLVGSIPANLGLIQHLQTLDLSNNSINGSIPLLIFKASELRVLDLSNNLIAGDLPELVGELKNLELLNFSDNALAGKIPENLTNLHNLTVVSLRNNYFSGNLPSGFDSIEVLDLSSNLINGSLPPNFGGNNLQYLNLSYNRFSGEIPPEFGEKFPGNATLDLSFNNFTGKLPESSVFLHQKSESFSGNPNLCGKPVGNLCPIPSTISTPPNVSASGGDSSPPAIAAIPRTIDSTPATSSTATGSGSGRNGLRAGAVVGIVVGDMAGIGILALISIYVYQLKKKQSMTKRKPEEIQDESSSSSEESEWTRAWGCLRKGGNDEGETSGTEGEEGGERGKRTGELVTMEGEKELEVETLLKASAYILGASGGSITYKAVLEDGTAMAVRRIGESGWERLRDFENQVRAIAKLVHPNLLRIRAFYWASDEKLLIHEFVPNGSLATARHRKVGTSPCHLPWDVRLKIAKGVARGLTYIHEKKHVHGNLKPSNILLGEDMEPKLGDFGLERLVTAGDQSNKASGSARNFGSQRSTASRDSFQDIASGATPSPISLGCVSPYLAPESLRSLKPSPKWDVYSFGVVLLELMTGKVTVAEELGPGLSGLAAEEKNRVLRMADVAIRADVEGKEDALLALFKLGFSCISPAPQKRPSMKEALQVLEKFPSCSSSSSYYGH